MTSSIQQIYEVLLKAASSRSVRVGALTGMLQMYENGDFSDEEVEEIRKLLLKEQQEEKIESQQNSHD